MKVVQHYLHIENRERQKVLSTKKCFYINGIFSTRPDGFVKTVYLVDCAKQKLYWSYMLYAKHRQKKFALNFY
jgi:hypothetical protein